MIRNYQRAGGAAVDLTPLYKSVNELKNEVNSLLEFTDVTSAIINNERDINSISISVSNISSSLNNLQSEIASYTSITESAFNDISSSVTINANNINVLAGSVDSLQSSLSGISSSVTINANNINVLSTDFTSHTSLYDYKFRTLESSVTINANNINVLSGKDNSLQSSLNSLSSSIISINNILSTLSTATGGGGGGKTLTNPTQRNSEFTDPVLYSGPNMILSGTASTPSGNTYKNGVTLSDIPSSTVPAMLRECLVYGDFSVNNVNALALLGVTAYNARFSMNPGIDIASCVFNSVCVDYDLSMIGTSYSVFLRTNTINTFSIINRNAKTGKLSIYSNKLTVSNNIIKYLMIDALHPCTVSRNSVDTFVNTIGARFDGQLNTFNEWTCEIAPYTVFHHSTITTTDSLVYAPFNTINRLSIYNGTDYSYLFTASTSPYTAVLNRLSINLASNQFNCATFNVFYPLLLGCSRGAEAINICAANVVSIHTIQSVMTLNIYNNNTFASNATNRVDITGYGPCYYMGVTNAFPNLILDNSIYSLNMYIDRSMNELWVLSRLIAKTVNIKMIPTAFSTNLWRISHCTINYLNCTQTDGLSLIIDGSNSISNCTVAGGGVGMNSNAPPLLHLNVSAADIYQARIKHLDGTCSDVSLSSNAITLGGFYYGTSAGGNNTMVRLNTAF